MLKNENDTWVDVTEEVKNAAIIARDANGRIVPLSERFNAEEAQRSQDAAYMAAVEAGDMETAQRLVDDAAQAAGYASEPWYHGQPSTKAFTKFDPVAGRSFGGWNAFGSWFTKDKVQAEGYSMHFADGARKGGNVYRTYLKMENPLQLSFDELIDLFKEETGKAVNNASADDAAMFRERLLQQGYDSVQLPSVDGDSLRGADPIQSYAIALIPSQIKSADPVTRDANGNVIPLSQRFNPAQESILYQEAPSEQVLVSVPTITLQDLVGRAVFPIIADLTSAGKLYRGIDSTEIAIPIYTQGGPGFPQLPENVGAKVVWASQGASIASQKSKRAGQRVLGVVVAMEQEAHKSNATVLAGILATVQAYVTSGRMSDEQVAALDELIRIQGQLLSKKQLWLPAQKWRKRRTDWQRRSRSSKRQQKKRRRCRSR